MRIVKPLHWCSSSGILDQLFICYLYNSLSRPTIIIWEILLPLTSSLRATNKADRFSAWAKWASNLSSSEERTQKRMSGSVRSHLRSASNFSLKYQCSIKQSGQENYGHDHTGSMCLMLSQLLLSTTSIATCKVTKWDIKFWF